jgi:hypothetical protein
MMIKQTHKTIRIYRSLTGRLLTDDAIYGMYSRLNDEATRLESDYAYLEEREQYIRIHVSDELIGKLPLGLKELAPIPPNMQITPRNDIVPITPRDDIAVNVADDWTNVFFHVKTIDVDV